MYHDNIEHTTAQILCEYDNLSENEATCIQSDTANYLGQLESWNSNGNGNWKDGQRPIEPGQSTTMQNSVTIALSVRMKWKTS